MTGKAESQIKPYRLTMPSDRVGPSVFSSPHSGADYPMELLLRTHLPRKVLRSSEDAFVDSLFAAAPDHGAPLLAACFPRAWVDLNRADTELDPAIVQDLPRPARSPRILAGLGVIPRVVAESRNIMHGKIALSEAQDRIARHYMPYHQRLRSLLVKAREVHGFAMLFDCHSMPRDALTAAPRVNGRAPEIVLGDRFGGACGRWLTDQAMALFTDAGFRVVRNAPFAGGHITQTYGMPGRGIHALQIEIDRSIYMDEARIEKRPGFDMVRHRLSGVVAELTRLSPQGLRMAAE